MKTKILTYVFYVSVAITFYYLFIWVVFANLIDPKIHQFQDYKPIYTWDMLSHAEGDFDLDGKEDFVSFTGCAFLTRADINAIPEDKRCTASGIIGAFTEQPSNHIGQKYISGANSNLSLANYSQDYSVRHSYIAQTSDGLWNLYVKEDNQLKLYQIQKNGLLTQSSDIAISNYIDEWLYSFSRLFIYLAFVLTPLYILFSIILDPLHIPYYYTVYVHIAILIMINLLLYSILRFKKKKF